MSENKPLRGATVPYFVYDDYTTETISVEYTEAIANATANLLQQWRYSLQTITPTDHKEYVDYRTLPRWQPVWYRPKMPAKKYGRKGTRKGWNKKNPPRWLYLDMHSSVLNISSPFMRPAYGADGKIDNSVCDDYRTRFEFT